MNNVKWLKRKYPITADKFLSVFFESDIDTLKKRKFKIGVLNQDSGYGEIGDLCMFKRSKEYIDSDINGYEYPSDGGWTGTFEIQHITANGRYRKYDISYCFLCDEVTK